MQPSVAQTPSTFHGLPKSACWGRRVPRSCLEGCTFTETSHPSFPSEIVQTTRCHVCSAQRLREELKEIALKRCDDSVAKFAACAREKGMMVVFSCREQNRLSE